MLQKIYKQGVTNSIDLGCDIQSSKKVLKIANQTDFIYAAVGLHPEEIPQKEDELWKILEEIKNLAINNKKVVAIGEIGLDYYWRKDNKELQKTAFVSQIGIANELNLPISIHTRDAIDDMIQIIMNNQVLKSGVLHCCPFNPEMLLPAQCFS